MHLYLQDICNWTKQYSLILHPTKHTNNAIHSSPKRALNKTETNYNQHNTPHKQGHKNTKSNIGPHTLFQNTCKTRQTKRKTPQKF